MAATVDEAILAVKDHAVAVRLCLQQLVDKNCLTNPRELAAIGFKAVHAKDLTGVQSVPEYPWTVTYSALKRTGS